MEETLQPVVLEVWDAPRPDASGDGFAWIRSRIEEFTEKNPHVTINLVEMSWHEMVTLLDQRLMHGGWPDVVPLHASGGGIRFEHMFSGLIEPLDDFLAPGYADELFPAARHAFTHEGRLYGLPSSMSLVLLLLNLDIFRERGVEPPVDGRWTFEQFSEACRRLTFSRSTDGAKVYGFSAYIQKGYYELWPFLYMHGARPLSRDLSVYTFDSAEAVAALQSLVDLKHTLRVTSPEMGTSDHGGIWHAFASPQERTIAITAWPDWAIRLATEDPRYAMQNIQVAAYPTGKASEPVTIGSVHGWSLLKQTDAAKRKAAVEFMMALSSSSEQEHFATVHGVLPASRLVARTAQFRHPELGRAAELLEYVELLPVHREWASIESSINMHVQMALLGEKSAHDALRDARREVEESLSLR